MNAEVIAIGDEIASGQILDTNSRWLSQRLIELGIRVLYHTTVGDELEPCAAVLRQAIGRADVVVVTGGLGPTADDLTREALAEAADRPLVEDAQALEQIRQLFARRARPMPDQNRRQAFFPAGSQIIPNAHGTAPGIDLEVPREGIGPSRVFVLPGVPAEMKEMWHATVAGSLRRLTGGGRVICHRNIKCFGAGESHIESMLPDLIRRGRQPVVGITASQATIILRITAEGATEQECQAAMEPTAATIYQSLGSLVFGEGDDELQHAVIGLLGQTNRTLATAEWGTLGLVGQWLGGVAGGEAHYLGGISGPGPSHLQQLLGIAPELLAQGADGGAELAQAMAIACRNRFHADFALATGPQPRLDPAASQPKSIYFALAGPDGVTIKPLPFAAHPDLLLVYCAKQALNLLRLALLDAKNLS